MIKVENLIKKYGSFTAVDNISFEVGDGEILGFLGTNGAGKSTTMNILTGYISCTSGKAEINGTDILNDPIKAKSQIGYLPEIPPLYPEMTVKEYLNFTYDLKKCKLPRNSHLKDICKIVGIEDVYKRKIANLSKGYKQRVGLSQALVSNPPILILDEPTVGLDPNQIIEIRNLIKKLGKKHTVIISSHILPEVQAVCDRIVIINKGKIVADDTEANLSGNIAIKEITLQIEGDAEKAISKLKEIQEIKCTKSGNIQEYRIKSVSSDLLCRKIAELSLKNNWLILEMKTNKLTLEDVFLKLTAGEDVGGEK